MNLKQNKKVRFDGLSGMRIFLIMFIAAGHFIEGYITNFPEWLKGIFLNYYFFTSIFFILSGFILTYVYFDEEKGIRVSTKRFLFLRFVKIYPVHLLFILLMASRFFLTDVQAIVGNNETYAAIYLQSSFFSQILLLDAWNPLSLSVNFPAWSVSALFFFYLIFPSFCRYIKDFSLPQLQRAILILWLLYLAYPIIYVMCDLEHKGKIFEGLLHHNPLLRLPEFLIGILFCRIFELQRQKGIDKLFYRQISPTIALLLSVLLYATLPLFVPYALLHNGFFLPVQILLILSIAANQDGLTRFLSRPSILKLSNASLTIFIAHCFLLGWWGRVDQAFWFFITRKWEDWTDVPRLVTDLGQLKNQPTNVSFLSFLVGLVALIIVSHFIQTYFVNPMSKWIKPLSITLYRKVQLQLSYS